MVAQNGYFKTVLCSHSEITLLCDGQIQSKGIYSDKERGSANVDLARYCGGYHSSIGAHRN